LHQEKLNYHPLALGPNAYKPVLSWFRFIKSTIKGYKYFKTELPDIIIFNGTIAELHLTFAILLARLTNFNWTPKIIRIFHSAALYKSTAKNYLNKILLSSAGRLYGHNKFVSNAVQQYWQLRGEVAIRSFPRKSIETREPHSPLRIGFFGRLSYEKGPDHYCHIIKLLGVSNNIQPVIIGDGEMMNEVKKYIPQGEFHGWVKNPGAIINSLDIVLITSRTEGLPLAYGECLEMGVPVMGFDVGGCSELLGKAAGLGLVKAGDFDALLSKLTSWAKDYIAKYNKYFESYDENVIHPPNNYLVSLGILQK
jgi:glycosyltransferase involved in cell wall biosynthesis